MLSNSSASDSSDDESESISISLGSPVHRKRTRHTFENQVPINTQIVEEEEVVATPAPVIDGTTEEPKCSTCGEILKKKKGFYCSKNKCKPPKNN
jgi:hypothetical protein